jgi:hypothetical protein
MSTVGTVLLVLCGVAWVAASALVIAHVLGPRGAKTPIRRP